MLRKYNILKKKSHVLETQLSSKLQDDFLIVSKSSNKLKKCKSLCSKRRQKTFKHSFYQKSNHKKYQNFFRYINFFQYLEFT